MAYREVRDQRGVLWYVWEVQPSSIERRLRDDPAKRPVPDRRRTPTLPRFRPSNPELAGGWLASESQLGKGGLCPFRVTWEVSRGEVWASHSPAVGPLPKRPLSQAT